MPSCLKCAGIAQLVERNLAKVEVASSSLVSRSKQRKTHQVFQTKKEASASFFVFKLGQARPSIDHDQFALHAA